MIFNFRNWVLQTFPFLEDDFDALTDYELFCKMMEYVKKFAKDNEDFNKRLTDLENYINNLDLQDEVNTKLNEMAEDGTLENLIGQYIELMTTYAYNNVEEMKNATNLVNGSFARTSGFYSYNDGGGAYYKVRQITNDDNVDEMTIIALSNNTLVAELIKEKEMSVKMFGAKGDNTTDDTNYIQTALNYCNNIIIDNGTYKINIFPGLIVRSNTIINLKNANIEALDSQYGTSTSDITSIFKLENVNNIVINGNNNYLKGDRVNHENTTDQYGFGILINNCNNVTIKNVILKDNTGDGINLIGGNSTNILIDNVVCDNNHRQGISVCSGENIKIINSTFKNTNGTNPQDGIDIEPYGSLYVKDVIIDNCYFYNNSGWGLETSFTSTHNKPISNIKIINNLFDSNISGDINIKSRIEDNFQIINNNFINSSIGVRVVNCLTGLISNNIINGANSYGVMLIESQNLNFSNNSVINGNSYGITLNALSHSLLNNNILSNNVGSGLMFYNSENNSEYNTISNNKIYDNGSTNYDNIEINEKTNYNTFINNDSTGTNYNYKYDINFASANTVGNIIANSIIHSGTIGNLYLRGNNSLMNIVNNVLDKGNLFI